jgi:16S rRNA processing protein RimM
LAPTRESAGRVEADDLRTATPSWVEVGSVRRLRGTDDVLHVELYGDETSNLERADRVQLDGDPGEIEFRIRDVEPTRPARNRRARARLRLFGLERPEQVRAWVGATLSIPESALESLPEGEYYWRDLIGLDCLTVEGEWLGKLAEIWPTGSNDVLVVNDGGRQLLVPALHEGICSVDNDAGEIRLELPDGLREEAE